MLRTRQNDYYSNVLIDISLIFISIKFRVCTFRDVAKRHTGQINRMICIQVFVAPKHAHLCAYRCSGTILTTEIYTSFLWILIGYHWFWIHFSLGPMTLIKMTNKITQSFALLQVKLCKIIMNPIYLFEISNTVLLMFRPQWTSKHLMSLKLFLKS